MRRSLRRYPFRHRLRRCHLPQGDGFSGGGKVSGTVQRRPLGGAGCERSEQTEGVFPAVSRYDPTCENGVQKRPQAFLYPEI